MAADQRTTLNEITDEIFARALLAEPQRHSEWHRKLDLILDHGSERDKIGIQQNLDWAAEHIQASPSRKRHTGS